MEKERKMLAKKSKRRIIKNRRRGRCFHCAMFHNGMLMTQILEYRQVVFPQFGNS